MKAACVTCALALSAVAAASIPLAVEGGGPEPEGAGSVVVLSAPDSVGYLSPGQAVRARPLGRIEAMSAAAVRLTRIGAHYHASHAELVYIIEGSGTFSVGGRSTHVGPGALVLIPVGVVHSFEADEGGVALALSVMAPPFDGSDRIFLKGDE